jgi:Arc/MetJ-type ribon-helix-helix transcriptional regulator
MSAVSAPSYDPDMSGRKTRLTVTVDPRLAAYAEQLVEAGKAPSVSAVFNDALAERVERDRRIRRRWKEAGEHADRAKVNRMKAHIDAQLAQLNT